MSTTSATGMFTPAVCISGISADDPYDLITRCLDTAVDGQLRTLAHLSAGSKLDSHTYRFPYEVVCRLAGRQQRGERFEIIPDTDTDIASAPVDDMDPRLCPCGKPLTGRADAKTCSPKCRQQVSRSNPERIAQKRGSRSVTAMNIPATPLSHLITANRRADGSLTDTFSDLPTPVLLARASRDSEEFNRRQAVRGRV
jgi:hypothetical protein